MADVSFDDHPPEFQAAARVVREWIAAHHNYLKDGGGSQGMHRVPRDALIAAVAGEMRTFAMPREPVAFAVPGDEGDDPAPTPAPKRRKKKALAE